jgi:hypothetical protein
MTEFKHRAGMGRTNRTKIAHANEAITPGRFCLISRMPSMVSMAEFGEFFGSPVARVKVKRVVDQVFGLESMVVDGDIVDAFGDFEFFLAGLGHAVLVNGQDDDGGVVFFGQFEDLVGFVAARIRDGWS